MAIERGSTCAGMSEKPAYVRTLFLFCFMGSDPVYPVFQVDPNRLHVVTPYTSRGEKQMPHTLLFH